MSDSAYTGLSEDATMDDDEFEDGDEALEGAGEAKETKDKEILISATRVRPDEDVFQLGTVNQRAPLPPFAHHMERL